MTSHLCTEEETVHRDKTNLTERSYKHCVDTHSRNSHTLRWHTDTHMATSVALGAAPTLTSIAGISALAGAVAPTTNNLSIVKKRSNSQSRYFSSGTGCILHMWPNGTVSGLRNNDRSRRKYGILEFLITSMVSVILPSSDSSRVADPQVAIKGRETSMWLCMNEKGELYGSKTKTPECEFREEYIDRDFRRYYSIQHPDDTDKTVKWYIALNKRCRVRKPMTLKHRSSRFKTLATHTRDGNPILLGSITELTTKPSTYSRVSAGGKSPSNRQTKERVYKKKRPSRRESKLSEVLTSIEKAIAEPPISKDSDPASYQDSMLIDLGESNPFVNIQNGDKIRHRKNKVNPKWKKTNKKSYRRKKSHDGMISS